MWGSTFLTKAIEQGSCKIQFLHIHIMATTYLTEGSTTGWVHIYAQVALYLVSIITAVVNQIKVYGVYGSVSKGCT